jgi:hypothetical protein
MDQRHIRHAQWMEIRGRFAAMSWDRDAPRRIGTSGLSPADLGEDHAIAVDVPRTIEHALLAPTDPPWQGILRAFGFAGDQVVGVTAVDGGATGIAVPAGRVGRVHDAWKRLDAWFFTKPERPGGPRVRVDLEPSATGPVADALRRVARATGESFRPPVLPAAGKAWLFVPNGEARHLLGAALWAAGVDLPEPAMEPVAAGATGGLLAWAETSPVDPRVWSVAIVSPELSDVSRAFGAEPGSDRSLPLAEGAAPWLVYDVAADRESPAGTVELRKGASVWAAAVGPEAADLVEEALQAAASPPDATTPPVAPEGGLRLVARFGLDEPRATKLLGSAVAPRGVLALFAGKGIVGTVWANDRVLRVELTESTPSR